MGKHAIRTSITIDAPPSRVWSVLLDFAKYSEWNPFLASIEGKAEPGETLKVAFSNGFKMAPRVVVVEQDKEFRWQGKLLWGGLFDGQHFFLLTCEDEGRRTKFEHGEDFSGILIGVMGKLLRDTEENFKKMNEAIKQRAESSA